MSKAVRGASSAPSSSSREGVASNELRDPKRQKLTAAESKKHDRFAAALQQAQDIESGTVDVDGENIVPEEVDEEAAMIAASRKAKRAALIALIVTIVGLLSWATLLHSNRSVGSLNPLHKLRHGIHGDLPTPMGDRSLAENALVNCTEDSSDSSQPGSPAAQASANSRAQPKKKPFNPFISFEASERNRCRRLIQSAYDLDEGRLLATVRNMITSLSDKWRHAMGSLISSAARVEREMRRRKYESLRLREEAKRRKKAEARNQTYVPTTKPTATPILADVCPSIPSAPCSNRASSPIQFRIYHAQGHCNELERFGTLFGGISGENGGFKCHPCDPTVLEWWPALRTETAALLALSEFHSTMGFGLHAPCMQWTGMANREYPFVAFLSHNHVKVPQWCDHLSGLGNDALNLKQRAIITLTEEIEALKLKMQLDKQHKSALELAKLHSSDDVTPIAASVAAVAAAVVNNDEDDDSWVARRIADLEDNLERINNHELKAQVDFQLHARYAANPYSNPTDLQNMAVTRDDSAEAVAHNPMADATLVPTAQDWWYPTEAPFIFHLYPLPLHFADKPYDEENIAMWVGDMPGRFREIMPDLYDIHYESLRVKTYGFASHFFIDYEAFRNYAKWILQFTMYSSTHNDCGGQRCMGYWLERSTNVYFAYMDTFAVKANIDAGPCTYSSFYSTSDNHAGRPLAPKNGFRERIDLISDLLECHTTLDWTPPNDESPEAAAAAAATPKHPRDFNPPAPGTHHWFQVEEWISMEELSTHLKPRPIANTTSLNSTLSTAQHGLLKA